MILEIRTYRLRPGTPSLADEDGHEEAYFMRAFPSLAARDAEKDAFYASAEWREGPREAIISRIEAYHTVVIEATDDAVRALRR